MSKHRRYKKLWWIVALVLLLLVGRNFYVRHLNAALIQAVEERNVNGVRRLLARGVDANAARPNPQNPGYSTPALSLALDNLSSSGEVPNSKRNAEEIACLLIEHHARLGTPKSADYVTTACQWSSLKVVQCLLEHGADVNAVDLTKDRALDAAVTAVEQARIPPDPGALVQGKVSASERAEREAILQLLLAHGRCLNVSQATRVQDITALRAALDAGEAPDQTAGHYMPPLYIAASRGDMTVVQLLVARGAHVNKTDIGDNYPLYAAAITGHAAIVRFLLDHGAEINGKHTYITPLQAVIAGTPELFGEMLRRGADIHANHDGALMTALDKDRRAIVQELLRRGTTVNSVFPVLPQGNTVVSSARPSASKPRPQMPLDVAVKHAPDCVELLLKAGADVRRQDKDILLTTTDLPNARLLLQARADINAVDGSRDTALVHAIQNRNLNLLKFLLDHGATVNTINAYAQTPLIVAVMTRHPEAVRLLLAHGAKADMFPVRGHTALYYAHKHHSQDIVKLLEGAGAKQAD